MRKALVEISTGLVVNIIEHEDDSDWQVPVGHELVLAEDIGSPGDTWDGTQFISVPIVPGIPLIDIQDLRSRLASSNSIAGLKTILNDIVDVLANDKRIS